MNINPEMTTVHRNELSCGGYWEPLPRQVIASVHFNPEMMAGVTDPKLTRLFNEDEIIKRAGYFAVGRNSLRINFTQAPTMHRGVNLSFHTRLIDEWADCFNQVNAKGPGMSFRATNFHGEPSHDPLGFFGVRHAQMDMDISNEVAALAGRTSRGLAILVIDHQEFKKWYEGLGLTADDEKRYNALSNLEKVKENGDVACIYVRLLSGERLDEYAVRRSTKELFANIGPYAKKRMVQRAAQVLTGELNLLGFETFQRRYPLPNLEDKIAALDPLTRGQTDKQGPLLPFQIFSFYFTAAVVDCISKTRYDGELKADLSRSQIDLTGRLNDWERSLKSSGQYIYESLLSLEGRDYLRIPAFGELHDIAMLGNQYGRHLEYILDLQNRRQQAVRSLATN